MMGMFDPAGAAKKKETAGAKKRAQETIKGWVRELLPAETLAEVEVIVVREFQCGDPKCAPIDTAIQVMFKDQGKPPLQTGLPKECHMLSKEDVEQAVEEMLNPELRGGAADMDPISAGAQAVYEAAVSELFAKLEALSFPDKMGVTQRLFSAVEEYEQRQMQAQAALQRKPAHPLANTLLSLAQQDKPEEIKRVLAESGLDPSTGNSVGQTALHVACLWGNLAAASALVGLGADVRRRNTLSGGTPLHITCASPKALEGRLACAALLLEKGADPSLADDRGVTALAYAQDSDPSLFALLEPYAKGGAKRIAPDEEDDEDDDDMPALTEQGAAEEEG